GINAKGYIVGISTTALGEYHAFVSDGSVMQDLNALIPAGSGWILTVARDVNDSGQIVGVGVHNGLSRGYRLDPITPAQAIGYLIQRVSSLNLPGGTANSLIAKLDAALQSVQRGASAAASNQLHAFIDEVGALQKTTRLDAPTATSLIAA